MQKYPLVQNLLFLQIMKKIPKKYTKWVITVLMSVFMAFFMTGIVTVINFHGFPPDYLSKWMSAFSKMVFIAFGVIIIVRPIVEKITSLITE